MKEEEIRIHILYITSKHVEDNTSSSGEHVTMDCMFYTHSCGQKCPSVSNYSSKAGYLMNTVVTL